MLRGVHGEKIVAVARSNKLPISDQIRLGSSLEKYDEWIEQLEKSTANSTDELIIVMVDLLNDYKLYLDLIVIFDSKDDFLYRQRGQLKLDNTVIEEFLPILVKKCVAMEFGEREFEVGSQTSTFSSIYFQTSLAYPGIGGGMKIKSKNQDFSMSRKLYLKSSYEPNFSRENTVDMVTNLGYVLAELKTNLDKTMFQEASATARDIKLAVTGAKYFLICDFLDMTPISTATTDIDEILIARKAKRIGSGIRAHFDTYIGRQANRNWYENYLISNPYSPQVFKRFVEHIFSQIRNEDLIEESVISLGYF